MTLEESICKHIFLMLLLSYYQGYLSCVARAHLLILFICSYTSIYVFMPALNNILDPDNHKNYHASTLYYIISNCTKHIFFLCKINISSRNNLSVQYFIFKTYQISLCDNFLVPYIKGKLGSKLTEASICVPGILFQAINVLISCQ